MDVESPEGEKIFTRRGEDLWPGDNESAWKEQREGVALRGGRVSQHESARYPQARRKLAGCRSHHPL